MLNPDYSFANDLNENPLLPPAIELPVKDLLPGSEVEFAAGDGDDDFAPHDLALDVRIGIILAGIVVPILFDGLVRDKALEKIVVVFEKAWLVIIDIYACADMHRIDQTQSFFDAALPQCGLNLRRDIDVCTPRLCLEKQFFAICFHGGLA